MLISLPVIVIECFFCDFSTNKQEGDGDFSQISSEENDFQLDDELPSNMVISCFFFKNQNGYYLVIVCCCVLIWLCNFWLCFMNLTNSLFVVCSIICSVCQLDYLVLCLGLPN